MQYIKVKSIFSKLSQATKNHNILYITGSVGMGKTAAVEYYFRRKPVHFFRNEYGKYVDLPPLESLKGQALVFDRVPLLNDSKSKKYILEAIHETDLQLVLLGRTEVPPWLASEAISHNFVYASNKDLEFSPENIVDLFSKKLEFFREGNDDYIMITEGCMRNTQMYISLFQLLEEGNELTEKLITINRIKFFRYMEGEFFDFLHDNEREACLDLCLFKNFTRELAAYITGNNRINRLLETMASSGRGGDYLRISEEGYRFRRLYREFFFWKRETYLPGDNSSELYAKGADWYEQKEDFLRALEFYAKAGDTESIKRILVELSRRSPGMEKYQEIYPYYKKLSDEQIESEPALMAGMCLMQSIFLRPEMSDEWYKKLSDFCKKAKEGTPQKAEAEARLTLLTVSLPHRKKDLSAMLEQFDSIEGDLLPPGYESMSFLDNTPSVLNAAVDICDLCLSLDPGDGIPDRSVNIAQGYLDALLGVEVTGYAALSRLEWEYERMNIDSHDIIIALNDIFVEAGRVGAREIAFVATVLMVRNYLSDGKFKIAQKLITEFKSNIPETDNIIMPGVVAFYMNIQLLSGDNQTALKWLSDMSSTLEPITYPNRQFHLYQIKVLITLGRYDEATLILGKMKVITKLYPRPYFDIQLHLLESIILYRTGKKSFNTTLENALVKAEKYGFIRMVAELGAALELPVSNLKTKKVSSEYLGKVREEVEKMSLAYPNYMQETNTIREPLTSMENKVIKLMCSELSTNEICERLHISYSGLKFHNKNIYRKLGVNNRVDAQRVAKSFGLNVQ